MNQVAARAASAKTRPSSLRSRARVRVSTLVLLAGSLACSSGPTNRTASEPASANGGAFDATVHGAVSDAASASAHGGGSDAAGGATRADGGAGGDSGRATSASDASVTSGGAGSAARVASKLGRDHFLIGLGNDLQNDHDKDGAYTLGVPLDLHYAYLVGLAGQGGWPDWNANGTFVNVLTDTAKSHGTVPMFTLYSMAAWGENNTAVLVNDDFMKPYWEGAKLLFQRLGAFGEPAVVHFEPDWWAYAQQQSHGDPSSLPTHVASLAPDCAAQPNNLIGMGKCLVALARKYAPKAVVGFHASLWADPDPKKIGQFLSQVGGSDADLLFVDMLDRDAGCFEAHTDPSCQRGGTTGWYLDESNQTSPNFKEHLASVALVAGAMGKPVMWWQLPLGVPSETPGGTAGHYRDNRVRYLFSHLSEFIAAGGVGAVFGTGVGNQTDITTDGDQLKRAVVQYYKAPVSF